MNTKEITLDITNGPASDRIYDSMKYSYDDSPIVIQFVVPLDEDGSFARISDMKIVTIQHKDGSGYSFNLGGFCDADLTSANGRYISPYRFQAYYNARTRKGKIRFTRGLI